MAGAISTTVSSTPQPVFYFKEPQKMAVSRTAAAAIRAGAPITMNTIGQFVEATSATNPQGIIGFSQQAAALGEECTVNMRAWAIITGLSAVATQASGPVKIGAFQSAFGYFRYAAGVIGTDNIMGISLDVGIAQDDLIQILVIN